MLHVWQLCQAFHCKPNEVKELDFDSALIAWVGTTWENFKAKK